MFIEKIKKEKIDTYKIPCLGETDGWAGNGLPYVPCLEATRDDGLFLILTESQYEEYRKLPDNAVIWESEQGERGISFYLPDGNYGALKEDIDSVIVVPV